MTPDGLGPEEVVAITTSATLPGRYASADRRPSLLLSWLRWHSGWVITVEEDPVCLKARKP